MAASPPYKVFDSFNIYQASTKDPIHAAVLADFMGDGCTVRLGHKRKQILWTAGEAVDSWDAVAATIAARESVLAQPENEFADWYKPFSYEILVADRGVDVVIRNGAGQALTTTGPFDSRAEAEAWSARHNRKRAGAMGAIL